MSAASAITTVLAGICGVFIGGSLWVALEGLAFTVPALALVAPTRSNIERRQREIDALGSPPSLGQALMDSTAPRRN